MRILFIITLVCCFSCGRLSAQRDSTFIELFPNLARVNTGFRFRDRSLEFKTSAGEELKLENKVLAFRIGGRYRFASYTFSFPIADYTEGAGDKESKNFGLALTLFMRQNLASAGFRKTSGFRTITPSGDRVFRDDVDLFTATLYGFHVFNNKRYSLRAGFRQRDRQLKTNGSFVGGVLLDRRMLSSDGLLVPLENGEEEWLTRLAQTKVGVGAGYAHTFVIGERFFVSPLAIIGPEFRFINYDRANEGRRTDNLRVSPRLRGYLAAGYNGNRTAVALSTLYLPSLDVSANLDTRFDEFTVELRITRRFLYPDRKKNNR